MADQMLTCKDCSNSFVFTAGEQEFYVTKGFSTPTRCPDCRAERKRQRNTGGRSTQPSYGYGNEYNSGGSPRSDRGEREMFEAVCASCGVTTRVPFKPRGHRPVYCQSCFERQRA